MLQASDLTKAYDGAPLFDGLSFVLGDGERAGLVGPNGVGKSTLLKLLAGVDQPDRGTASTGPGERIGWLAQEAPDAATTLGELLGAGLGEVWTVRGELRALEARLTAGDASPATLERYGQAQSRFEALGGWALEAALDEARRALAIDHLDPATPLARLSGGEQARALLAGTLLAGPDGPAARRADQPPRRRRAALAGGVAARLRRDGARRLPRPRVPRRGRRLHPRARARWIADPLRGRLQRSSSAARGAQGEAGARLRGPGEATTTPGGGHRDDAPPGAAHRAHREPRGRPQAQALRQEGGQEGQGARGPAAARARGRPRRDAAGRARGAAAAPGGPGPRTPPGRGAARRALARAGRRRAHAASRRSRRGHRAQRRRQDDAARRAGRRARARRRDGGAGRAGADAAPDADRAARARARGRLAARAGRRWTRARRGPCSGPSRWTRRPCTGRWGA